MLPIAAGMYCGSTRSSLVVLLDHDVQLLIRGSLSGQHELGTVGFLRDLFPAEVYATAIAIVLLRP